MHRYERPAVLASYSVDELRSEGAASLAYMISDVSLKSDVATIEEPLARLGELGGG